MTYKDSITLAGRAVNLAGKKFNKLTPIRPVERTNQGILWYCVCSCGGETYLTAGKIQSGQTRSCGCLCDGEKMHHNMTGTPTWRSWRSMRQRCNNKNHTTYSNWGGRGITICPEWEDFIVFVKEMGVRPTGMTLERIDNDGNYHKENCKWATALEQSNNRRNNTRYEYCGHNLTSTQWAERVGISRQLIDHRINKAGWSIEKALTTTPQKQTGKN